MTNQIFNSVTGGKCSAADIRGMSNAIEKLKRSGLFLSLVANRGRLSFNDDSNESNTSRRTDIKLENNSHSCRRKNELEINR